MLLETFKSLVSRFKKHEAPVTHPAPPNCSSTSGSSQVLDFTPTSGSSTLGTAHATCSGSTVAEHLTPHSSSSQIQTPAVSDPASTSGILENSHHNVFNNPTMVSISNSFNSGGGAIMQLLESKTIQGSEHDSSARYPPPKCHPETRQSLRKEIFNWITNPKRSWRMFYVLGPAGVGKSAVAQTVADDCKEADCLGASCFISRPNNRNDPDGVIPTLAYQLAVKHAAYKQIISQKIAHDPAILRKTRRVQFKELLVDPFLIIMTQDVATIRRPLLIIIDGLDECENQGAQCEFIELISDHVRSFPEFPLLWLLCSRPEPHLKYTLSQADFQVACRREEMSVNDKEGRRDVLLYLRGEFRNIRLKHQDSLDCNWPPETHLLRIATVASGLFAFASTVVRFIDDVNIGDPSSRLQDYMKVLEGSRTPRDLNPYLTLDLLYQHILSSVHSVIRPTMMRILGMSVFYSHDGPSKSVQALANFLLIGKAAFYHAVKQLHSVLRIPPSSDAFKNCIELYHASFADFLRDPERSGEFCLDEAAVHYDVALTALRWHTGLRREIQEDEIWTSPPEDTQTCLKGIKSHSLAVLWKAYSRVRGGNAASLYQELQSLDFNVLGSAIPTEWHFGDFLGWLHRQEADDSTQKLFNSLNIYINCNGITFTQVSLPLEILIGFTTGNLDGATKLHFDLGNGERRRHIHVIPENDRFWEHFLDGINGFDLLIKDLLSPNLKYRPF